MKQEIAEALGNGASKVQYTGAGAAIAFGLTANEVAALGGLVIAIIGYVTNLYYKRKNSKLLEDIATHHRKGDIPEGLEKLNELSSD